MAYNHKGGGVDWPPPSKKFDMAPISEKSWESACFWLLVQNPASARRFRTSRGSGKNFKIDFFNVNPKWTKKGLFWALFWPIFGFAGATLTL